MTIPICHIMGAGEFYPPVSRINVEDLVIAADGGYTYLSELNIPTHLLIGDFDSLGTVPAWDDPQKTFPVWNGSQSAVPEGNAPDWALPSGSQSAVPEGNAPDWALSGGLPHEPDIIKLPVMKDNTDTEAAIEEGWRRGYRVFHIYGGTGGRIDHTIANIQCLAAIARRGGRGFLFDRDSVITAIHDGAVCFPPEASGVISVFCHGSEATGVTETGLKYSLDKAVLTDGAPLGVSNQFTGQKSCVSVEKGTLIIIYPRGTEEINDDKEIKI